MSKPPVPPPLPPKLDFASVNLDGDDVINCSVQPLDGSCTYQQQLSHVELASCSLPRPPDCPSWLMPTSIQGSRVTSIKKRSQKELNFLLFASINKFDLTSAKKYIEEGADVNSRMHSTTPLSLSLYRHHFAMSHLLLDFGADVNLADQSSHQLQPLHVIAKSLFRDPDAIELMINRLVDQGANVNATDILLLTPLHWASYRGITRIVQQLINLGADCQMRDSVGKRPFERAVELNQVDCLKLLLHHTENIDVPDVFGWTALHHAAVACHTQSIQLLLDHGANISLTEDSGENVFHLVLASNRQEIVRILSQTGIHRVWRELLAGNPTIYKALRWKPIPELMEAIKVLCDADSHRFTSHSNFIINSPNENDESPLCAYLRSFYSLHLHPVNLSVPRFLCEYGGKFQQNYLLHHQFSHELISEINFLISHTRSLKSYCRQSIRQSIRLHVDENIKKLPIPNFLKDYLSFNV